MDYMDKGYYRFFQRNPMPEDEANKLFSHMKLVKFSKGDFIVNAGESNTNLYIIERGIWSGFECREEGHDVTLWFAFSGEPVINVWSYALGKKSPINIISETDSTAWMIPKCRLMELVHENPDILDCAMKIILCHMAHYENRLLQMSHPADATERYLWLSEWQPELLQEVPLSRIASFLGITMQSLSRIRRNIFMK